MKSEQLDGQFIIVFVCFGGSDTAFLVHDSKLFHFRCECSAVINSHYCARTMSPLCDDKNLAQVSMYMYVRMVNENDTDAPNASFQIPF